MNSIRINMEDYLHQYIGMLRFGFPLSYYKITEGPKYWTVNRMHQDSSRCEPDEWFQHSKVCKKTGKIKNVTPWRRSAEKMGLNIQHKLNKWELREAGLL